MQTNATVTTSASLMANSNTAEVGNLFCTFQNTANFGRFRVLKDKIYVGQDITAGTDGASTTSQRFKDIPFKCTAKFKTPINVRFNGTNGGTIGDVVDNSFYLSIQPSNESWASGVVVTALSRVYYKDA